MKRRHFVLGSLATLAATQQARAQQPQLVEPIHRVANAAASLEPTPTDPLDRALSIARGGLASCRESVSDYTALLVKRERVDDELTSHEFM